MYNVSTRAYFQKVMDEDIIGQGTPLNIVMTHRVFKEVKRDDWQCVSEDQDLKRLEMPEIMKIRQYVANLAWQGWEDEMDPKHNEAFLIAMPDEVDGEAITVRLPWFIGEEFGYETEE